MARQLPGLFVLLLCYQQTAAHCTVDVAFNSHVILAAIQDLERVVAQQLVAHMPSEQAAVAVHASVSHQATCIMRKAVKATLIIASSNPPGYSTKKAFIVGVYCMQLQIGR